MSQNLTTCIFNIVITTTWQFVEPIFMIIQLDQLGIIAFKMCRVSNKNKQYLAHSKKM